jgi:hypothetical protein
MWNIFTILCEPINVPYIAKLLNFSWIIAIATKEADRARAEKIHQAELDLAREAETEMKTKFEESQATSRSVQKTLATLVTEKQRLEQELAEVTAISEELATLCEKNKLM